jgi:tRNA modification GTPase
LVRHPDGTVLDQALITLFRAPHSYTGEDILELSLHGGALVPTLVLNAAVAAGARQALPGEFTRRAVVNGRMDLVQAEAVADLIDARSRMAHRVAIHQLDGGLSRRIAELRNAILDVEALIAYDIDFPDEDEGVVDRRRVDDALTRTIAAVDHLLVTGNTGEMLRDGALVVIGGAPNAGKSSLFNALLGRERAIVTDIAGTTRDAIEAVIDLEGWPVRIVDTAGLREGTDLVERLGVEISERYLGNADIVILCSENAAELSLLVKRLVELTSAPVVPVLTKSDLRGASVENGVVPALEVSALTGKGLDSLSGRLASLLSARFAPADEGAPLLTRERHRTRVAAARAELLAFRDAWAMRDLPSSVAAIHLRAAGHQLEELIGSVDVEDVLTRVFSTFCIGK